MAKDSELIDLSIGYDVMTGSNYSILSYYNKMIRIAVDNIGKTTIHGTIINYNLIEKLIDRRDEILGKEILRRLEKQKVRGLV